MTVKMQDTVSYVSGKSEPGQTRLSKPSRQPPAQPPASAIISVLFELITESYLAVAEFALYFSADVGLVTGLTSKPTVESEPMSQNQITNSRKCFIKKKKKA